MATVSTGRTEAADGRAVLRRLLTVVVLAACAVTVLLARLTLDERWSRLQIAGLACSALAVAAISVG